MTWDPGDRRPGQGDMTLGGESSSQSRWKAFLLWGTEGRKDASASLLHASQVPGVQPAAGRGGCMGHGHWYRSRFSAFLTKQPESLTSGRSGLRSVRPVSSAERASSLGTSVLICLLVGERVPTHWVFFNDKHTVSSSLSPLPSKKRERK